MTGRGRGAAPALNVGRGAPAGVAGGRGAAVGRGHPGRNSGAFGHSEAAVHSAAPVLPFAAHAERSAAEHAARFPSRPLPTDLCSVKACWTEQKPGALLAASRPGKEVKLDPSESVPPVEDPAVPEGKKAVNARALIFAGVQTGASSVLQRAKVIGNRQGAGRGNLVQAYGGLVPAGSDKSITQAMVKMVANQSGMDLSSVKQWTKLVEFNYDGDKPKSVFFLPFPDQVAEEQLFPKAVQKEETKEVEVDEEYETEVEEGEGDEKKTKKVKKTRKVKKDKVFKEPATTKPAVVSLHEVLTTRVTDPASSAYEFYSAGDALDEWLRRDSALEVTRILEAKKADAVAVMERKRKREEEILSVKRVRQEREEALRNQWREDDEGMTDDEKKEQVAPRKAEIVKLDVKQREEMKELMERLAKEEREAKGLPTSSERKIRRIIQRDEPAAAAFEIFDRRRSGTVPRDHLAACLLAAHEKDWTKGKCQELVTLGGCEKSSMLEYKQLTNVVIEREVTPSPVKKEETKEEKVENKADKKEVNKAEEEGEAES